MVLFACRCWERDTTLFNEELQCFLRFQGLHLNSIFVIVAKLAESITRGQHYLELAVLAQEGEEHLVHLVLIFCPDEMVNIRENKEHIHIIEQDVQFLKDLLKVHHFDG